MSHEKQDPSQTDTVITRIISGRTYTIRKWKAGELWGARAKAYEPGVGGMPGKSNAIRLILEAIKNCVEFPEGTEWATMDADDSDKLADAVVAFVGGFQSPVRPKSGDKTGDTVAVGPTQPSSA